MEIAQEVSMPAGSIVVVSLVVAAFAAFMITLATVHIWSNRP